MIKKSHLKKITRESTPELDLVGYAKEDLENLLKNVDDLEVLATCMPYWVSGYADKILLYMIEGVRPDIEKAFPGVDMAALTKEALSALRDHVNAFEDM